MPAHGLHIDASAANRMCLDLARLTAQPQEKVVTGEVGKILEATVRNMPAAKVSKIKGRHETAQFTSQPASLYAPKSGRKGVTILKGGRILYNLVDRRYPNALWAKIQAARKQSLKKALGSRGVAKQSFWQVALALGINIIVPGFVQKALATTGKTYPQNVTTITRRTTTELGIAFTNSQPNAVEGGGARALRRAIAGRVRYFQQNLRRGVFNSVANVAKRYPGVKVTV